MALTIEKFDQRIKNLRDKIDTQQRQLKRADEIKQTVPGKIAALQKKLDYDLQRRENMAAGQPVEDNGSDEDSTTPREPEVEAADDDSPEPEFA